jgi:hypothetical protein
VTRDERLAVYRLQNQRTGARNVGPDGLTPTQRSRVATKQRHLEAGGIPLGRVRRRHEARLLRQQKVSVLGQVSTIQAARAVGGMRKLIRRALAERKDQAA